MASTKKSSTKSKGLPIILLLILVGIILYGFIKMNNVQSPFSSTTPTPIVQEYVEQSSMDDTMAEVQESSSTVQAIDTAISGMDSSEANLEVLSETDLSDEFVGL
jgi:cytoskeletal protein RodZ